MTFNFLHAYHRSRRLDDYYSYADDSLRQHPRYAMSMLVVLGVLLAFVVGYALYHVKRMDCFGEEEDLIKEACSFGARDDEVAADNHNVEMRRHCPPTNDNSRPTSKTTASYTQQKSNGFTDGYITMTDVSQAVAA